MSPSKKVLTLVFLRKDDEEAILLGLKKRGFGKGKWNGFGGKVHEDETIPQGAVREVHEECGAEVNPDDLERVATIEFEFKGDPVILEVHVFYTYKFKGAIHETEEMRPKWYNVSDIPYDEMWLDDIRWIPIMLRGAKFKAYFLFEGHDKILKEEIELVS